MSFHQEDHNGSLESGQCLCDETLATVAKYFNNIFNSQMADGSLTKKHEKQIEFRAKCKLRHEMAKRYNDKIRHFANQRYGRDDRRHERGHSRHQAFDKSRPYKCKDRDKSHYRRDDRTHKTLPKHEDKAFEGQPCHIHRPKSQHSFDKCYKNPRNQETNFSDKKRSHKAHHKDEQEAIEDEESNASMDSPPASDSPASQSEDEEQRDEEQYHAHFEKKMKAGPQMAHVHVPHKRKSAKSIVSTALKKKRSTFLDNDLDIGLDFGNDLNHSDFLGLDSLMAADDANDVTNPFDFK
jgi:hypothetical protein